MTLLLYLCILILQTQNHCSFEFEFFIFIFSLKIAVYSSSRKSPLCLNDKLDSYKSILIRRDSSLRTGFSILIV